ncbi:serine-rich adhesin for platelets-like isoform X2 [Seriola aureovittata]|uniref:serine-rich adhesin for platelets-like isoform X2 n=1 Tax=Seriola aureovittata TaxID=2871759 RepID=UPI0024BE4809|nr:serine-rich adhesin for platelets-like isoform X2 [Seriola aureovittata]
MSADDFQTKYASVMESMLKSAIEETTKLFETMVDDLKAEISRIKKENEDLKTRCSQFENGKSQTTVYTKESEPFPWPNHCSEKRDTAVQCDLVPFRTMLVEQCQPLRNSSLQNQQQQCSYEEMEYGLHEDNYGTHEEGNSQMAFILVKQESILKQEEVEPTVVSNEDLPQATACGTENEGPLINQEYLTGEMLGKDEETQATLELPCLRMDRGLQGVQNQLSGPEHSLVISFTAIKDDGEDKTEVGLVTSEEQPVMTAQQQSVVEALEKQQPSVVPQQCQREGETSANEQTDVTLQQYAEQLAESTPQNKEVACQELKNGIGEAESNSQPVRRRRGRPPKKGKCPQEPVKKILESLSSDIRTEQDVANSPSLSEEEVEVSSTVDTMNITASEYPQAFPVKPTNTSSIVTSSVQERVHTASGDVGESNVGSLSVSVASLSKGCSSEIRKPSVSQQLAMETEAPSIEVSSATESLNSTPAESRQAPLVQLRARRTSVTLQDAILLVEAMNQSTEENTLSSPKRLAAPPQSQQAPSVCTLQTVDEVPAEPQTPPLLIQTFEAAGSQHITETAAQLTNTLSASPRVTNSTPTNEARTHIKAVIPQQHVVTLPFNTVSLPMSSSTAATQTNAQSQQLLPHPLKTSAAPSQQSNAAPHKIIIVPRSVPSLIHHKITCLSATKLPTFVSTVVAAPNTSLLPPSPAASLPLGKPSFSPVPQEKKNVTSRKLFPVVLSQSTSTSTDQKSGILPQPKITITVPRYVPAVASRTHQSQTVVLTREKGSAGPAASVTVSSSQLMSSSQELTVSVDAQTASNEVALISSQNRVNTTDHMESPKQTCSSLKMSVPTGLVPAYVSPLEQKLSPMVRLTKLPFSVSIKESVLVSRVLPNSCSETQSLLNENTTQENLSSVVLSTQPSEMPMVFTDICPSSKKISVSVNTSQISEEQNDIQEMALSCSETCSILGESYVSKYVHPSTPPKVTAPVLEKSEAAIGMTEPSASNFVEEIISNAVQDCALPNDPPTEDSQSAALLQLTSVTSKDTSESDIRITKTQFLAQLAVLPVVQAPEKASTKDCTDARASSAETSTSGNNHLQKNSLVARLRSHLKTHLQTRGTKTNSELCTETEATTVSSKKLRLEDDSPNDKNTTSECIPNSLKRPGVVEDVTSLNKATNDPIPSSPRRTGPCKDAFRPKRSVSEPTKSKTTSESTPRRFSSGRDGVGSKNAKPTSVSPRRSSSSKDDASPKNTKNGASPKNAKSTSVSPKRTGLTREGASLKKTESSAVSPGTSSLSENGTSPKMSELISVIQRRSTFTQDSSSTKQIKRESSSFTPRRRTTGTALATTKSETCSPSVRWPKLVKDGVSSRKTRESTPSKKPRLIQDGTAPKRNARVLNAKKLAKAAKAKTIAKIKNSNQSKLQNRAKTSQLAENKAGCEAVRKYTTKAVWIPPRIPASKTPSAGGKRSSLLPVKKEKRSPKSQNLTVVYPPSISLHPIPVKAPPIISPLQPLSVIGGRLLKNQCGECGRVLSSSAALESHVSLHTGRRPFSCTLCGKSFPDSKGLKRHGRVHRNGRIHTCQQCGKGFVYRFGLTKHLQMVHSRIKPFVCQICNKGFFTKRDVEAHIRIHTGEKPFHCNLCDKKFTRRVELNVHLRWHNGEKRHWCPFCGKGFLDLNNLKRHKYIHTGEKPHSCPHCPKHFTQSGHLKKHVKNVHKIE